MKSLKAKSAKHGTASSELDFLRELVLRQQAVIETLASKQTVPAVMEMPNPPALPEEIVKAIAEVTEPESTLGKDLRKRAYTLITGGAKAEDVVERITHGERPDV